MTAGRCAPEPEPGAGAAGASGLDARRSVTGGVGVGRWRRRAGRRVDRALLGGERRRGLRRSVGGAGRGRRGGVRAGGRPPTPARWCPRSKVMRSPGGWPLPGSPQPRPLPEPPRSVTRAVVSSPGALVVVALVVLTLRGHRAVLRGGGSVQGTGRGRRQARSNATARPRRSAYGARDAHRSGAPPPRPRDHGQGLRLGGRRRRRRLLRHHRRAPLRRGVDPRGPVVPGPPAAADRPAGGPRASTTWSACRSRPPSATASSMPHTLREIVIFLTHYAGWPQGAKLNSQVEELIAKAARKRRARADEPG